jgi:hypothetical protein
MSENPVIAALERTAQCPQPGCSGVVGSTLMLASIDGDEECFRVMYVCDACGVYYDHRGRALDPLDEEAAGE